MVATLVTAGAICDHRYRLGRLLGRGPLGTACEASHVETGERCCLKRLHGPVEEAAAREICQDEAAATALAHPGILALRASGFDESGALYLVSDLLPESLRDRLARGPLPPEEALGVLEQLCAILGAAHDAGVHHGDLKPTNVLFDEAGRVVVGDFGMYRLLSRGQSGGGTYSYLPPEYFREERKGATAAGDVFALGALLYECLSGERLFPAQTAGEAMLRICSAPLGPLSGIPQSHAGLQAVVAIACARDPAERFADPHAFSRAITTAMGSAADRGPRATAPELRLPLPLSRPQVPGAAAALAEQKRDAPEPKDPPRTQDKRGTAIYLASQPGLPPAPESSTTPAPTPPIQGAGLPPERVTSIWVPLPGRSSPALPAPPEELTLVPPPPAPEEATAQVRAPAPVPTPESRRALAVTQAMAAALGEITGRMRAAAPRRAWPLWAGLALLVLLGAGAYVQYARPLLAPAAPPAQRGPEEVRMAQRLRAARDRLAAQDYSGALAQVEEVLRQDPTHPTAQAVRRQASEGLRATALYDELVQAAGRGDAEGAVALYRRIPPQSSLHERGKQALAPVREQFEQAHLQLASAALRSRLCSVVESEVRQILAVSQDPSGAMSGAALEGQRLVSRCYDRRGHKKAAPDMAPDGVAAEGPKAQDAQDDRLAPLPEE